MTRKKPERDYNGRIENKRFLVKKVFFPARNCLQTCVDILTRGKISTVTFPPPGKSNKPYMWFTIANHTGSLNCVKFEEAIDSKRLTELRTGQLWLRHSIYGYGYSIPSRVSRKSEMIRSNPIEFQYSATSSLQTTVTSLTTLSILPKWEPPNRSVASLQEICQCDNDSGTHGELLNRNNDLKANCTGYAFQHL